ncbi:MAG: HipA N-terminal domain-containing protein [Bacteroidia bacterium]|nr:HipA N-terminal domain-containing protein [Bacteroidia bacterium]
MRSAKVLFRDMEAGILTQHDDGAFTFRYHDTWAADGSKPSISLTLPKYRREFHSPYLFPFFFNMLPEGDNKAFICNYLRIDHDDYFGLLLHTAKSDPIGAVKVIKTEAQP